MTSSLSDDTLNPLLRFYQTRGIELPRVRSLTGDELPEPAHHLLRHDSDMTSKLEAFHGEEISLNVLHELRSGTWYYREVVLRGKHSEIPFEYGAIEISLTNFPDDVRKGILQGVRPLGGILVEAGVAFNCQPTGYFAIDVNESIKNALELIGSPRLYGRVNRLFVPGREDLAHVVEILPPAQD